MRRYAIGIGLAVTALLPILDGTSGASATSAHHALGGSPLRFTLIQYNSPGSDRGSNASLNAEWVTIYNPTAQPRPLTGFHVHDAGSLHHYTFGNRTIGPHKSVKLHSGKGTNGPLNAYWGESNYVWNNDKDTATLVSSAGVVIDTCTWNDPSEAHSQVHC